MDSMTDARVAWIATRAAELLDDAAPAAIFYDLDLLQARLAALAHALPEALHTVAVKACPLAAVLAVVRDAGFGVEVASEGELAIASALGVAKDRVVFDSPAKTRPELALCAERGYRINLDNFEELARLARILDREGPRPTSVGIRVNPVIDARSARIASTFTGGTGSKFGVSLDATKDEIRRAFATHPWLDGLHVHTGSQGLSVDALVDGVARVVAFAEELERSGRPVAVLDIGGGLPIAYRPGESAPSFADYAATLRARVPELFARSRRILTEFGRAIFGPCATVISRVETTKTAAEPPIAVIHVGADMFVRPAYRPEDWSHELAVFDPRGAPKQGAISAWNVAGPLCFSGDFVARGRRLPAIAPGDLIAVRDVGAYTVAMWSRYNSRPMPAIYGVDGGGVRLLKPREPVGDVLRFWGFAPP